MADFCGLTRVKTWRWSRLFACAVAVFCAMTPINVSANSAYTCENLTVTCNPGFEYNDDIGICVSCDTGYYNAKRGGTCVDCPDNGSCPAVSNSGDNYGCPTVRCNSGYYRDYDGSTGLKCVECFNTSSCNSNPNGDYCGTTKNADSNNGFTITGGMPLTVKNDGVVEIQSTYIGHQQCNRCASGWYQKGYYKYPTDYQTRYAGANRCAKCPSHVKNGGCHINGEIYCDAGYYRYLNDDGTVTCQACINNTTKAADEDGSTDYDIHTCNICESGAYYYITNYAACNECPEHSIKDSNGNCNTEAMHAGAIAAGHNDIKCEAGHYRQTDSDGNVVTCEPCPDGYTTAYGYDGNKPLGGPALDSTQWDACVRCDSGYFRKPYNDEYNGTKFRLRSDTSLDAGCYACPSGDGVKSCGVYNGNDDERAYLLCKQGYYSVKSGNQFICKKCDGASTSTSDETYDNDILDYLFATDDPFWEIDSVTSGYRYSNDELGDIYPGYNSPDWLRFITFPSGTGRCTGCNNGYFQLSSSGTQQSGAQCYKCPSGASGCSTDQVNCKANFYLADNTNASDYEHRFSCEACPAFIGKTKDINHSVTNTGKKQCNICVDGYYGLSVNNGVFARESCMACPKFAKLNEMGICIRGYTDKPTDSDAPSFSNGLDKCVVRQATVKFTLDNNYSNVTAIPTFTDTMGTFEFADSDDAMTVPQACPLDSTATATPSGSCTLKEGTYCVYIDFDNIAESNKLDNEASCLAAIMLRSKEDWTGDYRISPNTAGDIMHHWGKENPWYCIKLEPENTEGIQAADLASKTEAQKFKSCLIGSVVSGLSNWAVPSECGTSAQACMSSHPDKVQICQVDGNGVCTGI